MIAEIIGGEAYPLGFDFSPRSYNWTERACQDFCGRPPLNTQNLDNSCFGNVQNSMTMVALDQHILCFQANPGTSAALN